MLLRGFRRNVLEIGVCKKKKMHVCQNWRSQIFFAMYKNGSFTGILTYLEIMLLADNFQQIYCHFLKNRLVLDWNQTDNPMRRWDY